MRFRAPAEGPPIVLLAEATSIPLGRFVATPTAAVPRALVPIRLFWIEVRLAGEAREICARVLPAITFGPSTEPATPILLFGELSTMPKPVFPLIMAPVASVPM